MTPLGLVIFLMVGCLLLKLLERKQEWGCLLCGGKRDHHPKCPRKDSP